MPKYALLRILSPAFTRKDIDGMALLAMSALETYMYRGGSTPIDASHDIRWIRSYWEPGGSWGTCLYEAPNMAVLRDFQNLCAMPFIEGHEVQELGDTGTTLNTADREDKLVANIPMDSNGSGSADVFETLSQWARVQSAAKLVRAYWNAEAGRATALYVTDEPDALGQKLAEVMDGSPARIVEVYPEEYE
jgi:hypothetical protein